jgi:hypothetical protein
MSPLRLRFLPLLLSVLGLNYSGCGIWADDDPLPNFNAPVDNSPLNVDKINRLFGIPMFKSPLLWNESDGDVAKRLGWPEESRTSTQSSYRLYPSDKQPVKVLGARAYSCVFYASHGKPTEVSIVFVNEGDYEWTQNFDKEAAQHLKPNEDADTLADDRSRIDEHVHDAFEKALKQDAQTLNDALTGLFGQPQFMGFGGGSETREQVKRWDWKGHAFLLSAPKDKYVTLRIVPTAFADNYGKGDSISSEDLKAAVLQNVKRTDSGDVVVNDIPMVDQGPKGYCVPATWERYMRYLGIPADMYVLAMAAGTSQRGTSLGAMVENVDSLVTLYHRRIDNFPGQLDMRMIAKNIDIGLPLMWTCTIHPDLEKSISDRTNERNKITDWSAWTNKIKTQDTPGISQEIAGTASAGGHQRMIIGYNRHTDEIAISDSWSKAFAIRWMTLAEANGITSGQTFVIEP